MPQTGYGLCHYGRIGAPATHMEVTSARRVLAVALSGAALAAGCGDLGSGPAPGPAIKPVVVSRQQVDRYRTGSPKHTLLAWYRSLQRGDLDTAASLYAPQSGVTRRKLAAGRGLLAPGLASSTPPRIVEVYYNGGRARLAMITFTRTKAPNGRVDTVRKLAVVHLVRTPRGWLLSGD